MSQSSIVTVPGAGAAANCDYPLVNDLFPRLEEYGKTLLTKEKLKSIAHDMREKPPRSKCESEK
jgi:hypothetical protein